MPWLSFDEQVEKLTGVANPPAARCVAPIMYEDWLHAISCTRLPTG